MREFYLVVEIPFKLGTVGKKLVTVFTQQSDSLRPFYGLPKLPLFKGYQQIVRKL
jgi:hypothetical protein